MASDTRDRLIRTTSRLLRTQGYGTTGLNQIVAEAEAPKGSMYFHFPGGKEELAVAALDRFAERVGQALGRGLDGAGSVADAAVAFFDDEIARLESSGFVDGCPVATVALDASAAHDALAASTGGAFQRWTAILAEALEAEGRTPEAAHAGATVFLATFEGALLMAKAQRSTEPLATARDAIAALLAAT
ncbi:TetR/AcrR family transcriptional regulator [Iamia sp. SCSIO 61187]|uniref:TetR/AcrR family transcriptional regulator n=1 Tax=Iamia sp. SCSIO 61187 TaxID=2722752 RepID=UPI001C632629|nr:TetR/AcrR family transcriptional regulator [Iamia sp. SCSIO 61187]QYG92272.1 TetR/AcrR family transcriptional regulator [Iamia sp. SCSIO 61187]